MLARFLLERNDIRESERRHSGECALDELQPDGQRRARAGFFFTQRNLLVVKTYPYPAGDLRRKSNEPCVCVILRGAGLPRGGGAYPTPQVYGAEGDGI